MCPHKNEAHKKQSLKQLLRKNEIATEVVQKIIAAWRFRYFYFKMFTYVMPDQKIKKIRFLFES